MYNLSLSDMDKLYNVLEAGLRIGIRHFKVDELVSYIGCSVEDLVSALNYWRDNGERLCCEEDGIVIVDTSIKYVCNTSEIQILPTQEEVKTTGVHEMKNKVTC